MTTDAAANGIKAWIELRTTAYPVLSGVQIVVRDDAEAMESRHIVIRDTGSEEHPVLRGVLEIGFEVELRSVPVATLDDEDEQNGLLGTTRDEHQALTSALYDVLADIAAVEFLNAQPGLKCFDIRNVRMGTQSQDDLRSTIFQMEVRACQS
jgi:hypothetical protein